MQKLFRTLFVVGTVLLFFSLFLDFYYMRIYREGSLLASWAYHPMVGWHSDLISRLNTPFRPPESSAIPISVVAVYIAVMTVGLFGALFRDIEKDFAKSKNYVYVYLFLLILNGFVLFAYPVVYLASRGYPFPYYVIENFTDGKLTTTGVYYMGAGYVLQMVGFLLVFPWSVFHYYVLATFEPKEQRGEELLHRMIKARVQRLDLDKLIARESTKIDLNLTDTDIDKDISYGVERYE